MRQKEIKFHLVKHTINATITNMTEEQWSETNIFVYCGAHNLNLIDTQKLFDSMNNRLALEYNTSNDIRDFDKSNAESGIIDFTRNEDNYTTVWCFILI